MYSEFFPRKDSFYYIIDIDQGLPLGGLPPHRVRKECCAEVFASSSAARLYFAVYAVEP